MIKEVAKDKRPRYEGTSYEPGSAHQVWPQVQLRTRPLRPKTICCRS